MYAITVNIVMREGNWNRCGSLPTFYLDENVQGITDERHAEMIARTIVDPLGRYDECYIQAVKV